ncbi:MAG: DNA mismatch repair protein [Chitinophagaceae bacterium]|nr:DNA mismatch repair protein [Chitinophagaceae bacterium]
MHDQRIAEYQKKYEHHHQLFQQAHLLHHRLGMARLAAMLVALVLCYYAYNKQQTAMWVAAGACVVAFVLLVQKQRKVDAERRLQQELSNVNEEEAAYLRDGKLSCADGAAYRDDTHAFSADLDIFGTRSLYQHVNRTATQMGRDALARSFTTLNDQDTIAARQAAVAELAGEAEQRHLFYAHARLVNDEKQDSARLLAWSGRAEEPLSAVLRILSFLMPSLLGVSIVLYAVTGGEQWWSAITYVVPLQLAVFFFSFKRIKKAIAGTEQVQKTLVAYAQLLRLMEQRSFTAPHLAAMQQRLKQDETPASTHIMQLAAIYASLENVQNPFAAMGMNGLYLHHLHALHRLVQWKKQYATFIPAWLQAIGDMEALNSLANLRYNNPAFCFPVLNNRQHISFTAMGHPTIPATHRVCNDVSFTESRFIILTGSNMSGKSTFLRTMGVNMVLCNAGSAVCAQEAGIHPMPMFVSMRQSDSLADNESYFFAEVKRLQHIIGHLNSGPAFVLLDEILRGTNSDDKRSGTIGVIEKIIRTQAIGAIATHDLEVCHTTDAYPTVLTNKCFEVETAGGELSFDYRLRSGICQNKNATFIMKKMGIID